MNPGVPNFPNDFNFRVILLPLFSTTLLPFARIYPTVKVARFSSGLLVSTGTRNWFRQSASFSWALHSSVHSYLCFRGATEPHCPRQRKPGRAALVSKTCPHVHGISYLPFPLTIVTSTSRAGFNFLWFFSLEDINDDNNNNNFVELTPVELTMDLVSG